MEKEIPEPPGAPAWPSSPSWQARGMSATLRLFVRRRSWGRDAKALARRARILFGAPWPYQWLRKQGLRVRAVNEGGVRGEWLEPARAGGVEDGGVVVVGGGVGGVGGDIGGGAVDSVGEASGVAGVNGGAGVEGRAGVEGGGVILYLHGGGYVSCSPATYRPVTAALARLTARRVFSLDYRLAPEHRYPAALDDAVAAYEWLLGRAGLPASAISIAGDSAGGGLVLGCLLRARDAGLALPACAVCFSPWTDLAGAGASIRANDGRCAMFRTENIEEFAAAYLPAGASRRDPYASPAHADLRGLPPLLLQVGSTELLLDDARMLDGFVPEARFALRQAASFIREHLSDAGGASKF
jgi:acetyl esterase/lipase